MRKNQEYVFLYAYSGRWRYTFNSFRNFMYNFYPGPSRIYPVVKDFAREAFESGILEKNHRSEDFMRLLEQAISLFKDRLNIPASYKVFFTSSATECWEICAQSFLNDAVFYTNGAFGEKWRIYTERITGATEERTFGIGEIPVPRRAESKDICIVANETSNGTAFSPEIIRAFRAGSKGLLVFDAVSSLGGVDYDISQGDIWIACSQKCLGLPSGMGILVVSPAALERAKEKRDRRYYNSALFMEENFDRFQTPYTPNILGVYLLKRLMEEKENVRDTAVNVERRAAEIYRFLETFSGGSALTNTPAVRSLTVVAVESNCVKEITRYLSENGVTVGKGYGQWKEYTLRIANFPAIPDTDFAVLYRLLRNFAAQ